MSEKDYVPSQDIPAVARAFGTLALAAATVVAIKWFLSHENKEEKPKDDNETESQRCPDAVSQDKSDKCNTPCLLNTGMATKPSILKVSDAKGDTISNGCMDTAGILQDKVLLENGQGCGGSLDTQSKDRSNLCDEETRGHEPKDTSTNYSANTAGQNVGKPIYSKTNNITAFDTSGNLHVTIPKMYAGSREGRINDTCSEALNGSCTERVSNKSLCERSKILSEHGNNYETQKLRIIEKQAYDFTVESHSSNAKDMLDDDCNTIYMLFHQQTSAFMIEKHTPESNVFHNRVLHCNSKLNTTGKDSKDTKHETEKSLISLQSENAGNALGESRVLEVSEYYSLEKGNDKDLILKTEMCTSQQNVAGPSDDSDVVNDGLLTPTVNPKASHYDVWFEENESDLCILSSFQKLNTALPSVSAPDDNVPLSNQVDDHENIYYNDSDDTHKNKPVDYTTQNDPEHKNPEIIFPIESSLLFQPLKMCSSNCDISANDKSVGDSSCELPDPIINTYIQSMVVNSDVFHNMNTIVLHSPNDYSDTTVYTYSNALERESTDVLDNCPYVCNKRVDTQAMKRTKEVHGETQSASITNVKIQKEYVMNCSTMDYAMVNEKCPSPNSCFVGKCTSGDTDIGSLQIMDITDKPLGDKTNKQCILSILINEPETYLLSPLHKLDVSNVRDTTGTDFALYTRDINLLNTEANSTEELSNTEANCPSTHIKNISIKMSKTGTETYQDNAYDFELPVELAPLCQQPAFNKMSREIFCVTEKESDTGIEVNQNQQRGDNIPPLYKPGTLKNEQNTVMLQIGKGEDESVAPLEQAGDILEFDLNVLPLELAEKTVPSKGSSPAKMHFSFSGLQPILTSFEEDVKTDYTDGSIITYEDSQKDLLKRSHDSLSGNLLLPRERTMSSFAENLNIKSRDFTSIPEFRMSPVSNSCENILSGVSSQRAKLKSKAKSVLCLSTEYYSSTLSCYKNGPIEEVSRGRFFRIPKSFQHIGDVMRLQLTLGNCLELLKLARKNSVPDVLQAVYMVISDNYLNVLKNTAIYGQLNSSDRERILHLRMRGRPSLCVLEVNCIFRLNKSVEESGSPQTKTQIYTLDIEQDQWNIVTSIPEEACLKGCSVCSMHNYLFIAGGIQKRSGLPICSNKLFCYNPLTDIWSQLAPMNQARSQLTLVPLDGYLFAIGGECLHTMEKYDPRSNRWIFRAPLPKGSFAVAHEATACGGDIYVSGGHLFYRLLKYSPIQDSWEECPFNASKGRSCDMVSIKNVLYRFDMQRDSKVSILKYNTTTKIWTEYSAIFPSSKVPFKCVVLNGIIYCLNSETTARFIDGDGEPVFESVVFNTLPTKGQGCPYPVVLNLPGPVQQTSV